MALKETLQDAVKTAMKSQDKARLGVLRMIMAAVKQKEVDERITLDDQQLLVILDKMVKDRRESIKQFEAGQRPDLVEKENYDITVLQDFLPAALSADEVKQLISQAIAEAGAKSMQDMGKVMNILKPQLQGRADMSAVSVTIKQLLS